MTRSGERSAMFERIVAIPRPLRLIDTDLKLVEGACRHVAKKCREASQGADARERVNALQLAARLERIADRMGRLRARA